MKYSIPQDRLDKIVFRYLDMQYGDLEKFNGKYSDIVFKKPNSNSEYGIMGWEKSGILYIYNKLIEEISDMFSMENIDSKNLIGRWVEDRYQIEVNDTFISLYNKYRMS
jgi:hypothetical protein